VAATTAGLQVAVIVATPAGLFRYMAAPVLLGFLTVPLLAAAHPADRPPGDEPLPGRWRRRPRAQEGPAPRSGAAA
jgi:hypothetical protein